MSVLEKAEASQLQLDIVACNSLLEKQLHQGIGDFWWIYTSLVVTSHGVVVVVVVVVALASMFAILENMLVSNG